MSVSAAPTLCDRCAPIFQGFFPSKGIMRDHHTSIQNLEQAANMNCIICRDVWKDLVRRSGFDRETLHVKAAEMGHCMSYHLFNSLIIVKCLLRQFEFRLLFRYMETQRKSAFQPSRVRSLCTNAKQWNIKPHSIPHPSGLDPPRT